jgi:hypothetical protein
LLDRVGLQGKQFITDDWPGYHRLIPAAQLTTGKHLTFPIEQEITATSVTFSPASAAAPKWFLKPKKWWTFPYASTIISMISPPPSRPFLQPSYLSLVRTLKTKNHALSG